MSDDLWICGLFQITLPAILRDDPGCKEERKAFSLSFVSPSGRLQPMLDISSFMALFTCPSVLTSNIMRLSKMSCASHSRTP